MNSGKIRGALLMIVAAVAVYYALQLWTVDRTRSVVLVVAALMCVAVGAGRLKS